MLSELRKVRLSPSDGAMHGYFVNGWPLTECMEFLVGVVVYNVDGRSTRRFGRIIGVVDRAAPNLDGKEVTEETLIYYESGPALSIWWADVEIAIAEVSPQGKGGSDV